MEKKSQIDLGRKTNLSVEDVLLLQALKPATERFKEISDQSEQNPQGNSLGRVSIDWDDRSVVYSENNGNEIIRVRKIDNGFKLVAEVQEEKIRPTLDYLLEGLTREK